MVFKKEVYNGLRLELYTPFCFQLKHNKCLCLFSIVKHQVLVDKPMCFEIHHYLQNAFYLTENYYLLFLDYLVSLELLNILFRLKPVNLLSKLVLFTRPVCFNLASDNFFFFLNLYIKFLSSNMFWIIRNFVLHFTNLLYSKQL